jgi:hypothetical protein
MPQQKVELAGQRFGRLEVIRYAFYDKKSFWLCRCDCGREGLFASANLRSGNSQSCGCDRKRGETVVRLVKENLLRFRLVEI